MAANLEKAFVGSFRASSFMVGFAPRILPPPPGSGVDLEGPALSLHNEMVLIQKCAMLQLRLGMLLMELEAYQLSQQTADPRRDNSTAKERAPAMRLQAHRGWNQAWAFNKAPCLLSFVDV